MSYQSIIDSFDVENNPDYQPQDGGKKTFCNIFAQKVMAAMDEPLPGGLCDAMYSRLQSGYSHWKPVGALQAQDRANEDYGTIGITTNHVVVIYPTDESVSDRDDIHMSMAGYACFNNRTITLAWDADHINSVKYYSYFPDSTETIVEIDTTTDVYESQGDTYTFETRSAQTPTVTVGTGGVVSLTHTSRDNRNGLDLWKLRYIGVSGDAAGIYTKAPGEKPLKRFVARVE